MACISVFLFFTLNLLYGMGPIVVLLVVQVYNCFNVLGVVLV